MMDRPIPDKASRPSGGNSAEESPDAVDLMRRVYEELRALAASKMQGERTGHTLQPTALVNEVFLKMMDMVQTQYNISVLLIHDSSPL